MGSVVTGQHAIGGSSGILVINARPAVRKREHALRSMFVGRSAIPVRSVLNMDVNLMVMSGIHVKQRRPFKFVRINMKRGVKPVGFVIPERFVMRNQ